MKKAGCIFSGKALHQGQIMQMFELPESVPSLFCRHAGSPLSFEPPYFPLDGLFRVWCRLRSSGAYPQQTISMMEKTLPNLPAVAAAS